MSIADLLEGKRVCVCGGSGGVGKTTTSAAVALGMAARGAKVAVVTIDPARRLANALGLEELENEPRLVESERLDRHGLEIQGELWAMMLDPKRTFDELIDRLAADPSRAEEIKANRVYRELSTAVSGSQEFTAVAKLYDLEREGDFDLLVLDTPPSRNALDFLDAPGRLTSFLEGRALKAFLRPTGVGMRVLGRGMSPLLGGLRRITGVDLLSDLSTFFGLLGSMTEDFSERAARVEEMLKADTTAFLLVTSAQHEPIDEAIWFRRTLEQSGLPFAGVIVNRVHHDLLGEHEPEELVAQLERELGSELAARVAENLHDYHVLARRDDHNVARLATEFEDRGGPGPGGPGGGRRGGRGPLFLIPHLDDDVHDVDGLLKMHRYLFASQAEREQLIADVVA
jgi:anion-transporting  ArsA/GET3 family ATPase